MIEEPAVAGNFEGVSSIRILPERIANQIAAGEVVERPVAVVKELVENSLDAGAQRIEIEFRDGGKSLIRVEDNGCGMSPDDALMALERHATSKIRETADLDRLTTFGFRGEALPSIASVARFLLRTRAEGWAHGTEICVNGGKHVHTRECGMPIGTVIEVAQLFNSVPARRKFLKSDRTEAAHIVHFCRLLAVAHPGVSFTLLEDGREVFRSPPCPTLRARIAEIYGATMAGELIDLQAAGDGWGLHGLIGQPGLGRATRQDMVTFVNRRPVESRTLQYALIEGYHTWLPKGRYPAAFLFLDLDPAAVDVNVHPAKREVRFRDEAVIRRIVIEALVARLQNGLEGASAAVPPESSWSGLEATPKESAAPIPPASPSPPPGQITLLQPDPVDRETTPRAARTIASNDPVPQPVDAAPPIPPACPGVLQPVAPPEPADPAGGLPSPVSMAKERRLNWRWLGPMHGSFLVFATGPGMLLLNWRAAAARIHYERVDAQIKAGTVRTQTLLFPFHLELDPLSSHALLEHLDFLNGLGYAVEHYGRNFFRVEGVPDWFGMEAAESYLKDAVALLRERGLRPDKPDLAREQVARLAAQRMARESSAPNEDDFPEFLRRLFGCRQPLADPWGRPTMVEYSLRDIERRFGLRGDKSEPDL